MVELQSKLQSSHFHMAVEVGLKEVLGESPMKVILSSFPDITLSPEKFEQTLTRIFGEGAKVLQRHVFTHLAQHSRVGPDIG